MSKVTDESEIIDKVVNGETEAFSHLIEKYQNMVFRYVYSKCNNYDEAHDITQDIFIMALEAIHTFRKEAKFSTWLYSIMINYCKNYRKKKRRMNVVPLTFSRGGDEFTLQIPDEREDPEEKMITGESLEIVKNEITQLPEDYRDILVMRDIEGLSYNEISDILDITLSNVKVRIHRGREMLKNRLQGRGLI